MHAHDTCTELLRKDSTGTLASCGPMDYSQIRMLRLRQSLRSAEGSTVTNYRWLSVLCRVAVYVYGELSGPGIECDGGGLGWRVFGAMRQLLNLMQGQCKASLGQSYLEVAVDDAVEITSQKGAGDGNSHPAHSLAARHLQDGVRRRVSYRGVSRCAWLWCSNVHSTKAAVVNARPGHVPSHRSPFCRACQNQTATAAI